MNNEERQKLEEKSYLKLFIDYKKQLKELGVPIDTLGDTMISAWFDGYMKELEVGNIIGETK